MDTDEEQPTASASHGDVNGGGSTTSGANDSSACSGGGGEAAQHGAAPPATRREAGRPPAGAKVLSPGTSAAGGASAQMNSGRPAGDGGGGGGGGGGVGSGAGGGGSGGGAPLFSVERVKRERHAFEDASVDELWEIARRLLASPDPISGGLGGGGGDGGRQRQRRGARQTDAHRLAQLEQELTGKMQELTLLQQQRAWLASREEVLQNLVSSTDVDGAGGPRAEAPAGTACPAADAAGAAPPAAARQGAPGRDTDASMDGGSGGAPGGAQSGPDSVGTPPLGDKKQGRATAAAGAGAVDAVPAGEQEVAARAREVLADVLGDRELQDSVRGMTARQYMDAVKGFQMEYALMLQHMDDAAAHARLLATINKHRRMVSAACLLATDAVLGAQFRHMETGELQPPPQSHWARALDAIRPPLAVRQERRLVQNVLAFRGMMQALEDERRAILAEHADLSSPEAASQLQSKLDAVLKRVNTVVTTHTIHALYEMTPMQWAAMNCACYPYTPSNLVMAEMLRRHLIRLADS